MSPPILVDFQRNGRTIKGLIDVARDGYLWFLDRSVVGRDGRMKFVEGKPFVHQNVFKSLDPETGRPDVDPAHKPGTGKAADFCPNLHGGKNWPPIAFSPKTRMIYVPANNNLCGTSMGAEDVPYVPGRGYTGTTQVRNAPSPINPGADHFGEVQAWNVDTGQKVWTHNYAKSPNWGAHARHGRRSGLHRRHQRSQDSTPSTRPAENCCGSRRRLRESSRRRRRSPSTASSTSQCSPAGAATPEGCKRRSTERSRASIRKFPKAAACGCTRSSKAGYFPQPFAASSN